MSVAGKQATSRWMRTDEPGHDAAYCGCDAEEVGDGVGVEELVLRAE